MNIAHILSQQAQLLPEQPAIIEHWRGQERVLRFGELERASAQTATLLRRAGLQVGDAVLVCLPMSAELYITLGALFRLGLVAVFVDPSAGAAQVARCCAMMPLQALIATPLAQIWLWARVPALRAVKLRWSASDPHAAFDLGLPGVQPLRQALQLPADPQIAELAPEAAALLTFTSGSTGLPKAAVRSHGFLLAQHQALAAALDLRAGQIDLTTLPIVLLANLASGVSSVLPAADLRRPGAIKPAPVVAQLQRWQIQRSAASPALLARLAEYCARNNQQLPALRQIVAGGAAVTPPLLESLQRSAPNARVMAVYGSTEAEPIAHITREAISAADRAAMQAGAGLLAGHPVSQIAVRIIAERPGAALFRQSPAEFEALQQPCGSVGEIVVSGAHVLAGYLHGHGDTEHKIHVGGQVWHRTGDAGYFDAHGRLWLLGRCAARITDSRGTLYPLAVEAALAWQPEVRRAAVLGLNGQRVLALEAGCRLNDSFLSMLAARLAWAGIDRIMLVDHIPVDRRHNAKIDYTALYARLANCRLTTPVS